MNRVFSCGFEFLHLLCPLLTDTVPRGVFGKCPLGAFLTHRVVRVVPWTHGGESFSTSNDTPLASLYAECEAKPRVVPVDWAPCPGLQRACGTQVMHSSLEQWNPVLQMQVLRTFLLLWTTILKFLSESRHMVWVALHGARLYLCSSSGSFPFLLRSQYGWRLHLVSDVYTSW